jgi:predicted nucleic acid-binding protein
MIFVDTWAWLALAYKKDPYHAIAVRQHRALQQRRQSYVTTDYVLSEFITALFRAVSSSKAEQFVDRLFQLVNSGQYQLVFVSPGQFERAWQMRQRYRDKPDISFVDFTSMVVMQDLGIAEVFTGDAHFQQVGLGFRLVP